uniref:hypothetical protein n=1 Tax=Tessaracoccus bendigoensis TaxID=72764 RepID=UPI001114926D|nr:hypothetical protein [Tessaracoccus bendigoensis]
MSTIQDSIGDTPQAGVDSRNEPGIVLNARRNPSPGARAEVQPGGGPTRPGRRYQRNVSTPAL